MGSAAEEDQQVGERLVGGGRRGQPAEGLRDGAAAGPPLRLGMHFETAEQASANLQPRVDLASGEAPGQGGSFADRFRSPRARPRGRTWCSTSTPPGRRGVLSDMSTGPVLFATC